MRGTAPAVLVALALVFAACGDSGGDVTTTGGDSDDTVAVTQGDGGDTTTTAGDGETPATAGGDLPGAAGDVAELLERFRQSRVRATYLMNEGDDQTTMTLSQDPNASPPLSAIISEDDGFSIIFSGDTMTMCDASEETCFQVPSQPGTDPALFAGAFLTPFLSSFLAFSTAESVGFDVDTDTVEVAGRSGVCFTVTPEQFVGADFDEVRQCVDDETGAMLLFEIKEGGGEFERVMELVEIGDPRPDDFVPPFPLVELPTG